MSGARRLLLAAALLLLVVAIGWEPVRNWRTAARPLPKQCELFRNIYAHTVRAADHGSTSALVIGDSWSAGLKQPDTTITVATWLATDVGWDARIDAFSGSGFVNPGPCGDEKYAARTSEVRPTDENVVFQGGLNDVNTPGQEAQLAGDAAATLKKAAARAPTASIIVVGPPLVPARSDELVRAADRDLAAVCRSAGVTYVSTLGWKGPLLSDGLHPTAAGSKSFAAFIAARLR